MRLFQMSDRLTRVGDYVVVNVLEPNYGGKRFDAVLVRTGTARCHLIHNHSHYHGSEPTMSVMQQFNCRYGWSITSFGDDNITEIMLRIDDSGRGMKIVKVYNESEHSGQISDDSMGERPTPEDPDFYAKGYEKRMIYCGQHSYHAHHSGRPNQPVDGSAEYRFGVEMEVEFCDEYERDEFTDKTSNWFYCERDGSLNDYGCEIITIPLNPKDAKDASLWSSLTDALDNAEASDNCGLHVHVSRSILDEGGAFNDNLGKLLYLYHHHVEGTALNRKLYGRARTYNAHDGKTREGDAAKRLGTKIFKYEDVKNRVSDNMRSRSRDTRYFDINIQNSNTIEFRKGAGTTDPNRVVAIIEYCELLCLFAKKTPWEKLDYSNFVAFIEKKAKSDMLKKIINQYK